MQAAQNASTNKNKSFFEQFIEIDQAFYPSLCFSGSQKNLSPSFSKKIDLTRKFPQKDNKLNRIEKLGVLLCLP
jgi:hypothetical protein